MLGGLLFAQFFDRLGHRSDKTALFFSFSEVEHVQSGIAHAENSGVCGVKVSYVSSAEGSDIGHGQGVVQKVDVGNGAIYSQVVTAEILLIDQLEHQKSAVIGHLFGDEVKTLLIVRHIGGQQIGDDSGFVGDFLEKL